MVVGPCFLQRLHVNSPWLCPFLPPALVLRSPSADVVSLPVPHQPPHGLLCAKLPFASVSFIFFYSANPAAEIPLSGVIVWSAVGEASPEDAALGTMVTPLPGKHSALLWRQRLTLQPKLALSSYCLCLYCCFQRVLTAHHCVPPIPGCLSLTKTL